MAKKKKSNKNINNKQIVKLNKQINSLQQQIVELNKQMNSNDQRMNGLEIKNTENTQNVNNHETILDNHQKQIDQKKINEDYERLSENEKQFIEEKIIHKPLKPKFTFNSRCYEDDDKLIEKLSESMKFKSEFIIIIEEKDGYKFGVYLNLDSPIKLKCNEKLQAMNNSCFFILKNHNNSFQHQKIDLKQFDNAFCFTEEKRENQNEICFSFFDGTLKIGLNANKLIITTFQNNDYLYCQQFSSENNELIRNASVDLKQFIVYEPVDIEKKEEKLLKKLKNDNNEEIKVIKEVTNMKFKKIPFDSDVCGWNIEKFKKIVEENKNNIIIIEDNNGNVFGIFQKKSCSFCNASTKTNKFLNSISNE